jgi:NAD(P)-dependent dehydrogenase (short-subunit alcohol dehydrogenase family)
MGRGKGRELFDLNGKVAVVTGATKGIGRAIAEGLAQAGAGVVVSSRKQELCDQVAAQINAATGARAVGLACHVGQWEAIPEFVEAVVKHFDRVDVLVNNAGINLGPVAVADMGLDHWRKVQSVNLEGPLGMSQCVAPLMRDGGGGSIVHIGAMGAYVPGPGMAAYAASKAALHNLTKVMAMEWASWKVRVNIVHPGPVASEMLTGGTEADPRFLERVAAATYLKRVADPSEVVGPVLYLASDASSFVTGDDITVSGGMAK